MKKTEYLKIGHLSKKIADAINKPAGDICITVKVIEHINATHSRELKSVGLDALGFVKFVANNFTQILADYPNKSLLLAYVPEVKSAKVIVMAIAVRDGKYFVKTALPMKETYLKTKQLIWTK